MKVLYLKNYFSHFVVFLWNHVDECLKLEDSFESQAATRARLEREDRENERRMVESERRMVNTEHAKD